MCNTEQMEDHCQFISKDLYRRSSHLVVLFLPLPSLCIFSDVPNRFNTKQKHFSVLEATVLKHTKTFLYMNESEPCLSYTRDSHNRHKRIMKAGEGLHCVSNKPDLQYKCKLVYTRSEAL